MLITTYFLYDLVRNLTMPKLLHFIFFCLLSVGYVVNEVCLLSGG